MTPKSMTPKSMTPKSMTPKMTPESPRKSRMGPKKSALAQVSASQDEEDSSLNDSDLVPTNKGKFEFYELYELGIPLRGLLRVRLVAMYIE